MGCQWIQDACRILPPFSVHKLSLASGECLVVSLCVSLSQTWQPLKLGSAVIRHCRVDRLSAGVFGPASGQIGCYSIQNSVILIIWLDTCKSVIWIIQDNYWHTSDWWITAPEKKARTPPRTYVPVLVGGANHIMILYVGSNLPNHAKAMQKTENTWKFIPNRTWYIV